jgi:hypothetical protein
MKLTDILREIEDEQGGEQKAIRTQYDLAIQPESTDKALQALSDIKNYGMYAQNMRDPKTIVKVFGPSIPAQKSGAAWKDWDTRSDIEKDVKIADIKNRVPEAWNETIEKNQQKFEAWKAEDNEGEFEDWLKSLPGKSLPLEFYGKYGKNYFPMKTPDNLKKYAGKMEQDVHYMVDNGMILFPQEKSPFNPKAYLRKVLKTIMDNANVAFKFMDIERGEEETDASTPPPKFEPQAPKTPPLSTTVNTADQADKLKKLLQNRLGDVPSAKFEVEPVGDGPGRQYKLVVTGITADQRLKLQPITFDFKQKLKEELDWEQRQMLVRAGIIK